MVGTIVPKLAKLPAGHNRLWLELRPGVALGFVLYGDTALSLHLGHRPSAGFEFFRARALDKDALRKAFSFIPKAAILDDAENTLAVAAPVRGRSAVTVSFCGGVTCGRVGDPLLTQDGVLEAASLDDLMAHKLRAVLARPEKKDYEDIAAMIRAGCSVSRGLAAAQALFGRSFQPATALKALVGFEGRDLAAVSGADRGTVVSAARVVGILPTVKLRSRTLAIPITGNG